MTKFAATTATASKKKGKRSGILTRATITGVVGSNLVANPTAGAAVEPPFQAPRAPEHDFIIYTDPSTGKPTYLEHDECHALYWPSDVEDAFYAKLAQECTKVNVKTSDGVVEVLKKVSVWLRCNGKWDFPSEYEAKQKFIRMRAGFLEFWNFVNSNNIPFNSDTGKVQTSKKFRDQYVEDHLAMHFIEKGFRGFYAQHVIFMQRDAAHLPEEQLYYFLRDDRLLAPIDELALVGDREENLFRCLGDFLLMNSFRTEEGLLLSMEFASQRSTLTIDVIRRVIRRKRNKFTAFFTFIISQDLDAELEAGNLDIFSENHYLQMNDDAKEYFMKTNLDTYLAHCHFYVKALAPMLSEENEHYFEAVKEEAITLEIY